MGSQDVDSIFANIPLEETIDIYRNTLFENIEKVAGLSKIEFKQLSSLATKESYLIFNGQLYKQVDGVALGSPLGPMLANAFLVHFEKIQQFFLDIAIIREDKTLTTCIYRKPIFSGVYTHFDSFLPSTYKFGTVYTLAYRCF